MENLNTVEIKSFIPARNFSVSKAFYTDLGFEITFDSDEIAYVKHQHCSFLLQNSNEPYHAENTMMHLLVEDAISWFEHVKQKNISENYNVRVTELEQQPWGMLEFCVFDPSGVLWRIAQNT